MLPAATFADKTGVCTLKREVAECSSAAQQCYGLQPHHQTQFNDLYAGAHAQVCVEPSGVQCLITNIAYTRCTSKDGKKARAIVNWAHAINLFRP